MHFHKPLPELPTNEVRGEIFIVCQPSPVASEVSPPYSGGSTPPPLLTPTMPLPDPIPIPPQLINQEVIDSSDPTDTVTTVAFPMPSVIEIPASKFIDKNHSEKGWQPNICREGILYPMQILDEDNAITITPYLYLDLNGGNPHIEGTLEQGCLVTSHPLHATSDHYPHIMLTEQQLQYFRAEEAQMALANETNKISHCKWRFIAIAKGFNIWSTLPREYWMLIKNIKPSIGSLGTQHDDLQMPMLGQD